LLGARNRIQIGATRIIYCDPFRFLRIDVLLRFLRDVFRAPSAGSGDARQRMHKIAEVHARAPMAKHVEILFGSVAAGGVPLPELVERAHAGSDARTPPLKTLRRHAATQYLCSYFAHARALPGRWAECGVFRGTSALSLCLAARGEDPAFDGAGLHLVDSFEGLSAPSAWDGAQAGDGNRFSAPLDVAQTALREFPGARFHKGWIPQVLASLPEATWSFVHVDVDLYEPTLGCLDYFFPRLVPGGVIICDDYGAPTFPGAERAWDRFCGERGLPFVVLPSGQSVLLRE
jgi:O-methyltransferase